MVMVQVQMVVVPEAEEWGPAEEVIGRDITKTTNLTTTEDHFRNSLAGYLEWVEDTAQEGAMEGDGREEGDGKCPAMDMAEATGDMD